ncbi:DNA helicase RecQ [Opitutus terrae]|uniref:DNA helicase RecQ n=1 Tax=Opitutus terrae (strain DSM 11246 / JCM 15787 / PB90-1) TaxID=452637 RepID=B1ZXG9_OPITP|nr:DNA helicase RecQ [Opitutus terrae]ACB76964.1 ATP-dependent DNA helicase RecQ [Opitutus terrae PB90-1]
MPLAPDDLDLTLKRTFGYGSFRPLQREIIAATLAGQDVFALLPTGGGKSLCFQLPALVRPGLTVVVSPLIALMKDQVDALQASGVAATFLNSTLDADESRRRLRGLHQGEFKLLYVAPERLMLNGWQDNLRAWQIACLAIDEAHCISEWGHDFRPEYRQLAKLRRALPDVPAMALTATATTRVRADIIEHLKLREPAVFVASFNRPNLTYRVIPKDQPLKQIIDFVRKREDESGIIYCASRAAAERLAESLAGRGFSAKPYHAGLTADERTRHQEEFLRDDARIVCATIAFGMGINKPNVRWVIHHDLPKNIEGYYQETGRAGRDGLPGDCLLLFSAGDIAKQLHFLDEITDEQEQQIARTQLRKIVHYAESAGCRRAELLAYFGETFGVDNCGACDNCLEPRETYDGTLVAQKLLSCVYRIQQNSGFSVGLNHLIEVLTGADTDKIRRWGHDRLTTYGIGAELSRSQWAAVGRELTRLGLLTVAEGEYATLALTRDGLTALVQRTPITLTKPMDTPKAKRVSRREGEVACDEILFTRLRGLRKQLADERRVPAYIVFGDTTLRAMARYYPQSLDAMEGIPGMGEKKRAEFGARFAAEIAAYLQTNSRQSFG